MVSPVCVTRFKSVELCKLESQAASNRKNDLQWKGKPNGLDLDLVACCQMFNGLSEAVPVVSRYFQNFAGEET